MIVKEVEFRWEQVGDHAQGKWDNLTRAERTTLSERRHSHEVKLHELYGITEEEAELAAARMDGSPSPPKRL